MARKYLIGYIFGTHFGEKLTTVDNINNKDSMIKLMIAFIYLASFGNNLTRSISPERINSENFMIC